MQVQAGFFQHFAGGRDRPKAHQFGFHPGVGIAHQACQWLKAQAAHRVTGGQHQAGGAIVDTAGVAGGDGAVFLEHRLHAGQLFGGHISTHMLVDTELHAALAGFQFQRNDLAGEAALGNRTSGAALAGQGQFVLHFAGNAVLGRNVLGSDAHVEVLERVLQHADGIVDALQVTHACTPARLWQQVRATAHGFGAGRDGHIGVAQQQALGRRDNSLQARPAQAVDVECRCFLGDASVHCRNPCQVGVTRFGGDYRAHHQVADLLGGQARTLDGGAGHGAGQVGQWQVLEGTAEATNG